MILNVAQKTLKTECGEVKQTVAEVLALEIAAQLCQSSVTSHRIMLYVFTHHRTSVKSGVSTVIQLHNLTTRH
jgi:intracellular sulfur oxidation DsrE/DsrF family protein